MGSGVGSADADAVQSSGVAEGGGAGGAQAELSVRSACRACRYSVRTTLRSCLVAGMVAVRANSSQARLCRSA